MATFVLFNSFKENVFEKVHKLDADVLKWMLTNTAPALANTVKANITEIAAGTGYTAGGATCAVTSSGQTGGTYSLVIGATTFTAAGGGIGPFRYAVLYNSTSAGLELIGYLDYGTAYTLPDTQSFPINAGTIVQASG